MNREAYRYILAALLTAIVVVFVWMTREEPEPVSPTPVQVEEPETVAIRPVISEKEPEEVSQPVIPEEDLEICPLTVTVFYDIPLDIELQAHISIECGCYGIDPTIVFAMIDNESDYRAEVIGDNGKSYGLMQIKKEYHRDRMEKLGATDLLNPYWNVMVGIDYLAELLDIYDGNMNMALMAYNAGPSGANKYWFSKGIYSNNYSQKVVEISKNIKELTVDGLLQ